MEDKNVSNCKTHTSTDKCTMAKHRRQTQTTKWQKIETNRIGYQCGAVSWSKLSLSCQVCISIINELCNFLAIQLLISHSLSAYIQRARESMRAQALAIVLVTVHGVYFALLLPSFHIAFFLRVEPFRNKCTFNYICDHFYHNRVSEFEVFTLLPLIAPLLSIKPLTFRMVFLSHFLSLSLPITLCYIDR